MEQAIIVYETGFIVTIRSVSGNRMIRMTKVMTLRLTMVL